MNSFDHPIFLESIDRIKAELGFTGLDSLQQQVLERLIHSSGDFGVRPLLRFSPAACDIGLSSLKGGAPILTDTAMAFSAIAPMALRTLNSPIHNVLQWAPDECIGGDTRTSLGMQNAWKQLSLLYEGAPSPIVVIGSSPTALDKLLDLVKEGAMSPSLIIGMPVGFVGVKECKSRLFNTELPYISLVGSRGGAGLAASALNALLRAAKLAL